jgi:ABC-type polysaccharide/polyol phosphate export permease
VGRYRYLFSQLVQRELRRRYKGTSLGVLWYLINPLVLMGAYTLLFGHLFQLQHFPDYPVFLIVGLMVWTFFQQSLLAAADSLIEQGGLVRRARFPRETIPAAAVTVQLVTFGVILALLIPLSLALRGSSQPASLLLLPLLIALLFGFVAGCGLVVAVTHAYYRDVAPILAAALVPWFFLTPIFYQADSSIQFIAQHPAVGTLLNWVNPVAPFIEAFRSILYYGTAPDLGRLVYMALAAALALTVGTTVFRRLEGELAVVL